MSDVQTDPLWIRIATHPLLQGEDGGHFLDKLARQNGWSGALARRAVTEYQRYVYLAMRSKAVLSPSYKVDQVWHLHLTYTKDYWRCFCPEVLGYSLHHQPTSGGEASGTIAVQQYIRTLLLYRDVFAADPPIDLWPNARQNLRQARTCRWVSRAECWVIPKPRRFYSCGTAALLATVAQSDAAANGLNPLNYSGPEFLVWYFWISLATLAARGIWTRRYRNRQITHLDALPAAELAMLAGGPSRTLDIAVASLLQRSALRLTGGRLQRTSHLRTADPLESAILHQCGSALAPEELVAAVRPQLDSVVARLRAKGMLLSDERASRLKHYRAMPLLALLALGGAKLAMGVSQGLPVLWLALMLAVVGFLLLVGLNNTDQLTGSARELLRRKRTEHQLLRRAIRPDEQGLAIALFGIAVLSDAGAAAPYAQLRSSAPGGSDATSSGCSGSAGSDGGGSDGGSGCGGCGGGGD